MNRIKADALTGVEEAPPPPYTWFALRGYTNCDRDIRPQACEGAEEMRLALQSYETDTDYVYGKTVRGFMTYEECDAQVRRWEREEREDRISEFGYDPEEE
jgi:hypothetical protein